MNLRRHAKEALDDVSSASKKIVTSTEWATVALVAVATVSILALGIGLIALHKVGKISNER
jgi:cell division protein FtsX